MRRERYFLFARPTTYPLKDQAICSRVQNPRLYVSFPLALAAAIDLRPGDQVQWDELHLVRIEPPPPIANHPKTEMQAEL